MTNFAEIPSEALRDSLPLADSEYILAGADTDGEPWFTTHADKSSAFTALQSFTGAREILEWQFDRWAVIS